MRSRQGVGDRICTMRTTSTLKRAPSKRGACTISRSVHGCLSLHGSLEILTTSASVRAGGGSSFRHYPTPRLLRPPSRRLLRLLLRLLPFLQPAPPPSPHPSLPVARAPLSVLSSSVSSLASVCIPMRLNVSPSRRKHIGAPGRPAPRGRRVDTRTSVATQARSRGRVGALRGRHTATTYQSSHRHVPRASHGTAGRA
jgi:hypothetical protein